MDLCCLDPVCVSVSDKTSSNVVLDSANKEGEDSESVMTSNKLGKNKGFKETTQSMTNVLNRFTSQIKKPPHRKSSPLNWFPRKKVEPYLKRKIKLLQEVDGLNLSLDETLGEANPHYCRVKREQIAAREAAFKAMEARKAALVEASWCRILRAARIKSKEAETLLLEAEKVADEAFEEAIAMGVTMFDFPNCPSKPFETETLSANNNEGGLKGHHSVAALFATAFEVDKEVAAAVKTSFTRLAHCASINKDEFKDLLRKISQNPDIGEKCHEYSSECESGSGLEFESDIRKDRFNMAKLVDMMLERLKCLKEEELESIATIVATCGLNAALAEVEQSRPFNTDSFTNGQMRKKQVEPELPSLDKFLVKHMTKLEREVLEAKNTRNNEARNKQSGDNSHHVPDLGSIFVKHCSKFEKEIDEAKKNSNKMFEKARKELESDSALPMPIPDLGSILIKHSSKLEKEIEETKKNCGKDYEMIVKKVGKKVQDISEVPSLEKVLVKKHVSRLEREVQEAKNKQKNDQIVRSSDLAKCDKRNIDSNSNVEVKSNKEPDTLPLDKLLVKHASRLEREVQEAKNKEKNDPMARTSVQKVDKENVDSNSNIDGKSAKESELGLDKILVKPVQRLQKEKMLMSSKQYAYKQNNLCTQTEKSSAQEGGLDQILVKHKSRLEREKMAASQQPEEQIGFSHVRRREREREQQQAWGGIGLGNSIQPRLSKLERDKAAWIKAEEEERRQAKEDAV